MDTVTASTTLLGEAPVASLRRDTEIERTRVRGVDRGGKPPPRQFLTSELRLRQMHTSFHAAL